MRIVYFRVENFRNLRLAECDHPPDFMVICGGNGCGKSALLSAVITAKERASPYNRDFRFDPRAVSADAEMARIILKLKFDNRERDFVKTHLGVDCPEEDEIVLEIRKDGQARTVKQSKPAQKLLGWYSREMLNSPGFFDYIEAYRRPRMQTLTSWDSSVLTDERTKATLSAGGDQKFNWTKQFLSGLKMHDLQHLQTSVLQGKPDTIDSLEPIRTFFNDFFAPLKFVDVRIDTSPFQFIIHTPRGEIDIDDMSAGEKEVLNTYVRFQQLNPQGAVILFDEVDAHLHPDLERRYLKVLRQLSQGNQVWCTTHSPEMMITAGNEALYTVLKEPPPGGGNQFRRVSTTEALHEALSDMMGSRGLVSFNQRIIFIEGEESSADRDIYEHFYPPGQHNVSFVPAGNSATVRKTAEKVNVLLTSALGFQQYFSIVDGDIDRALPPPAGGRLHQLPVYHIENLLLDEDVVLSATRDLLLGKCPYATGGDVVDEFRALLLCDTHLKPYTRAILDAKLARMAKQASDAVFKGKVAETGAISVPTFAAVEEEARAAMTTAGQDGSWKEKCKGRDLMKAYCAKHGIKYDQFRNLVMSKMTIPPVALKRIMDIIAAS